jgi:hypothetical protein
MTTAKPPARYSAKESARAGDFAMAELHHPLGHDLQCVSYDFFRLSVSGARRGVKSAAGPACCTTVLRQEPARTIVS